MQQLLPETQSILKYIAIFPRRDQGDPTSPAITESELLSNLHSIVMPIPYMVGISPQRWRQIIDVMLEKKPGERKIHRL